MLRCQETIGTTLRLQYPGRVFLQPIDLCIPPKTPARRFCLSAKSLDPRRFPGKTLLIPNGPTWLLTVSMFFASFKPGRAPSNKFPAAYIPCRKILRACFEFFNIDGCACVYSLCAVLQPLHLSIVLGVRHVRQNERTADDVGF